MPSYKVVGFPRTRTMRVIWMLEELEQDYELDPSLPQSDFVRSLNPLGKVPVLLVDGEPLVDSVAIVTHLADAHGAATFPAGTLERARQDAATQFCVGEVDAALWTASKHAFVLPKDKRVAAVRAVSRYEFDRAMEALEGLLGDREHVMGDRFTVPDLLLGHCASWAAGALKWDLPGGAVGAYFDRLAARPARLRAQRRAAEAIAGVT